ncbi:MAG: hypothetical protein VYB77_04950 [Planctomycetota bacterium]|nr:hypothetical protein [Planctomycetota bacterium]
MHPRSNLVAIPLLLASSSVLAQDVDFTVDQQQSLINGALDVQFSFGGTLIGDYDAETNPTGTRTLPGFFGGSGNNPISYTADASLSSSQEFAPSGSFSVELDLPGNLLEISGLVTDVLGGGTSSLDAGLDFTYDTFRTVDPNSLYIGGFAIPVPLGEITLSNLVLQQVGISSLTLGAPDESGTYPVTGTVQVESSFSFTLFGEETTPDPVPLSLPVSGLLIPTPGGYDFQITASSTFDDAIPTEGFSFDAVPLPLPTILPPGGTANILLSGVPSAGTAVASFAISILANGVVDQSCPGDPDLNGDDLVNGADLANLLFAWGGTDATADLNCDGVVNGSDLTELLFAWTP